MDAVNFTCSVFFAYFNPTLLKFSDQDFFFNGAWAVPLVSSESFDEEGDGDFVSSDNLFSGLGIGLGNCFSDSLVCRLGLVIVELNW